MRLDKVHCPRCQGESLLIDWPFHPMMDEGRCPLCKERVSLSDLRAYDKNIASLREV